MKLKHPVCKFGHELTRENTRRVAGQKVCVTCAEAALRPTPAPPRPEHCAPHSVRGCSECERRAQIAQAAGRLRDQERLDRHARHVRAMRAQRRWRKERQAAYYAGEFFGPVREDPMQ